MRPSITTVIKISHVIILYYYDRTSQYIRNISDIQEIMMNDVIFQFKLKNKYGRILIIQNNVTKPDLRLNESKHGNRY
jgi:hypothetical protein